MDIGEIKVTGNYTHSLCVKPKEYEKVNNIPDNNSGLDY